MLRKTQLFWFLIAAAVLGIAVMALALFTDWLGAVRTGMPWGSSLACRGGKYYYVRPDFMEPGPVPHVGLVEVPRQKFERRIAVQSMAACLASVAAFLLLAAHFGLVVYGVSRGVPWLVPRTREGRRALMGVAVGGALFVGTGVILQVFLAPRLTGMSLQSIAEVNDGEYFSNEVRRGRGPGGILVPISREQYEKRKRLEALALPFRVLGALGICSLGLYCVVMGYLRRSEFRVFRGHP